MRTAVTRGGGAAPTGHFACTAPETVVAIKAKLEHCMPLSLTNPARHSRRGFSFCPASPKRPLRSGDKLGAPDTVLGCAGQKWSIGPRRTQMAFGTRGQNFFCPTHSKLLWDGLKNATGDALTHTWTFN
jgi:hypothetical protein